MPRKRLLACTHPSLAPLFDIRALPTLQRMQDKMGYPKGRADTLAQLFTPVSMQLLSTPLHLYGLDLYNRSGAGTLAPPPVHTAQSPRPPPHPPPRRRTAVSAADRAAFIRQEYLKTALERMVRTFPAFGVGLVVNKDLRARGKALLASMYPAR